MADSAAIPVPEGVDVLLVTIAASQPSLAYVTALAAIAGSLIGSLILFGIARKGGEVFLARHVTEGSGRRLHTWFLEYGLITVFVPAATPIPLPMKIPVFCAGALAVSWTAFVATLVSGRAIRYFGLAFFARKYGVRALALLTAHWIAIALVALSVAVAAAIGARLIQGRMRRSS
ncbi:MAG: VTT domain-containing protein [Acidobacteriaceae bacterium]|nr:VTT domain-containing protein [Acidobacteriaceae bacterium]